MTKRKKTVSQNFSSNASSELTMNAELDIKALRTKNKALAQALANLQQDKSRQQYQMNCLQEDYYKLNSKFLNLQNISTSVGETMRECLPLLLKVVNMFTHIIHVSNAGVAVCNGTPNRDARTQTVKPQIVNGHVLHNPTINLSRLNGNMSESVLGQSVRRIFPNNELNPSTSASQSREHERLQTTNSEDDDNGNEIPTQYRRRDAILETRDSRNNFENDNADDATSDEDEEEEIDEEDNYNRLLTVQEEDDDETIQCSQSQDNWRDVRILLNQLPIDAKENRTSLTPTPRKSSLICQTGNSVLDNETLLDEMMSSTHGTSRDDSVWSSIGQSPMKRVCMVRGGSGPKTGNNSSSYSNSTLCPTTDDMRVPSGNSDRTDEETLPTVSNRDPTGDGSSSKLDCMKRLGLEPNLMTSTPVLQQSPGPRTFRKTLVRELLDSQSPVSKVMMKRGSSGEKVLAKVVLQRMSLEKRLSGSPIKKIGDVLDIVPITRSSDIKKSKRRARRISSSDFSDSENDVQDTQVVVKKEKRSTQKISKGKENEASSSVNSIVKTPRPKRAARPTKPLVEPSLGKKMRRSK